MIFCLELWAKDNRTGYPRAREHVVETVADVNKIISASEAPYIALGNDYYYSPTYITATNAMSRSRILRLVWDNGTDKQLIFARELISKVGVLKEELTLEEAMNEFVTRVLEVRICAAVELSKHLRSSNAVAEKEEKKRVLFFSPFGSWLVHNQLDAVLATTLAQRGAEVRVAGCDGLFQQCCYITLHDKNRVEACQGCANTSKDFFAKFGIELTQISAFISNEEVASIRQWADNLQEKDLLGVKYEDLPVGRWAAPTTASYFRVPPSRLQDEEVRPVFKRYIGDVAIAFKAMSRLFDEYKPDQLIMYNGAAYLYAAALAVARCRNIPVLTHERGMSDGSFMLVSNQNTGNPLPYFEMVSAWSNVALAKDELAEIKQYYVDRENGVGSNYAPFYNYKSDHAEVRKKLNIPADAKIVSYFSSSEHEMIYWEGNKKFERQLDFVDTLIDIFSKRKEYLVVRHHPNVGGSQIGRPDFAYLKRAHEQAQRAPANVRIIMPHEEITSYALLWHSTACLGAVTTMANEIAARAIPCAAFDVGYMVKGVSHRIESFEYDATSKLVEDLLNYSSVIGVEDLRKVYRFTNALYRKFSTTFKSVRITNGEPWVQIGDLQELLEGQDAALDRVCSHILKGTSIYNIPSAEDVAKSNIDEQDFFAHELEALKAYKATVAQRAAEATPIKDDVFIVRLGVISEYRDENAFYSWYRRQRLAPKRGVSATLKSLATWPSEVIAHVVGGDEPYVMVAPEGIVYDPSFISASVDFLNKNREKAAVVWGAWVQDRNGTLMSDVYGRDSKLTDSAGFLKIASYASSSAQLLGLALWRKEALLKVLTHISSIGSEHDRMTALISILNEGGVELKRRPMAVLYPTQPAKLFNDFTSHGHRFVFHGAATHPPVAEIGSKITELTSVIRARTPQSSALEVEKIVQLLQTDRNREALVILDQVIPQLSNVPVLFYAKAIAQARLGERSGAIGSLQYLLQIDPGHEQGREMLSNLTGTINA